MKSKRLLLLGIISASLLILGVFLKLNDYQSTITVNLNLKPHTADPYEFDHMVHHAIFPSILSPLVSITKKGIYQGIVAEKWEARDDYKTWIFTIRQNLKFSDEQLITPEVVAHSFKRIIFLQKKAKSQNGLSSIISGIEKFNHLSDLLSGISVEGATVIFSLNKSTPNLLDIISFGLYSIVSEQDYDSQTGLWKMPRQVTSSGGYRLKKWTEEIIEIELRPAFLSSIEFPKRASSVLFIWNSDKNADIFPRTSINPPEVEDISNYQFYGPVPSGITFIRLASYKRKESMFFDKQKRKIIRDCFYRSLQVAGQKVAKSFLPFSTPSELELAEVECKNSSFSNAVLTYAYPKDSTSISSFGQKVIAAFKRTASHLKVEYKEQRELSFVELIKKMEGNSIEFDLFNMGSYVTVEKPYEDIRFMFLSKEGIKLPDETGEIIAEIKNESFSLQKVNKLIWDQALVWPIAHFSYGFWGNNRLDFTNLNLVTPMIDFNWIGVNH